ncbi:hypothetical protein [Flavobacterium sp. 3HN19-14]
MDGKPYVVFLGSTVLMETIKQIEPEHFPLETTIIKNGERYEFS